MFAARNAIDDDLTTEWATTDDGNSASITLDLGSDTAITGVEFVTRSMADGTATTSMYTVTIDGAEPLGPFPAGTVAAPQPVPVTAHGRQLIFEVVADNRRKRRRRRDPNLRLKPASMTNDRPGGRGTSRDGSTVDPVPLFSGLSAVLLNCSLVHDGSKSHTRRLLARVAGIMRTEGVDVDLIHMLDHQVGFGMVKDTTEIGDARDDWPAIHAKSWPQTSS